MVFFFPSFNVRWIVPLFCPKVLRTVFRVFRSHADQENLRIP